VAGICAIELLDDAGFEADYNLKVIIDTEEEMGSPNLPDAVTENRDLLAADMLLIFDGPPHPSNEPTVGFGARGIVTVTLVTHGPKLPQHSGHYGNFVPNPAFHLSRILSSMKSANGRVTIPGFYDGVSIDEPTRAILEAVPDDEEKILADMGLIKADAVAPTLQEAIQYPSLNIRGMSSGWVGKESRTIVPSTATAEIDIRLVKESDYRYLLDLVRSHIVDMGYHVIDHIPTEEERLANADIVTFTHVFSYNAYRSDMDAAAGRMARGGMRHLYGKEPILIRTSGGSVPISPFVETLGVPAAKVPTVNIDNNQHSPNENIRLGSFIEGIAILMSVMSQSPD
jgi:acetylornithine deacetylase/succinyl-diaminopimelate desuccinylase-like protein